MLDAAALRSRLKLKNLHSENLLRAHHPQAVALLESKGVKPGLIRAHATRLLASGATAAALLIAPSQAASTHAALPSSAADSALVSSVDLNSAFRKALAELLPPAPQPLALAAESNISQLFHSVYGIHAVPELEGNRLNTDYGLLGAEQHLPRYPGDTADQHGSYVDSGITPGRGAWGYFSYSPADLTPDLVEKEKYYVAVQTLYLPDWTTRLAYLRDWYKYRKVVMANPKNGKAVVAVIADSGPAAWTGKHFGASPEIMHYLQMQDGKARSSVVLFFVDDPDNSVPLGPLEYNLEKGRPLLSLSSPAAPGSQL